MKITKFIKGAVLVGAASIAMASAASAQTYTITIGEYSENCTGQFQSFGSFFYSCQNCNFVQDGSGVTLKAQCQDGSDGQYKKTSMTIIQCDDIENHNGGLKCDD